MGCLSAAGLRLLVAVEEAGDEEHKGDHERELGVGKRVQAQVDHAVRYPGRTSDEPDPGGFSHRWELDGRGWRLAARFWFLAGWAEGNYGDSDSSSQNDASKGKMALRKGVGNDEGGVTLPKGRARS